MSPKGKLYYLLEQYFLNKYTTTVFADEFTVTYDLEVDYESLTEEENALFGELCAMTARFSSDEEELQIPNVYFSEMQVKEKATEVYHVLFGQL